MMSDILFQALVLGLVGERLVAWLIAWRKHRARRADLARFQEGIKLRAAIRRHWMDREEGRDVLREEVAGRGGQ